ncbi:MAG: deoxyribose-phosphate aldolase [Lachnospiraceae bacterium]|nr:deoxyribose-phosphate aldolase [Lachnospiraceae bacterium]
MRDIEEILSKVDHTLLKVDATWEDIKVIIDDGIKYNTASVCIPPSFVKQASQYANGNVKICTVIGFPNGYSTTSVKCAEALEAVENGADEIDMVINVGWLKEGRLDDILEEINLIKANCKGKLLKVIIETCLLTDSEIEAMCRIVNDSDADFIKTSTGFSTEGANIRVVKLMKQNMNEGKFVKAAGGIKSLEDADTFLDAGADRLGTSRIVNIIKSS